MDGQKSPIFLLILVAVLIGFGCYHKDLMTSNADNVKATLLYNGPEGQFVITIEEIFQASSKETDGGITRISGHSEMRLTSYDLASGQIIARLSLGEMIEEANVIIGLSPGKLWMYGVSEDLGLHYRNPQTLEVIASWEQLSQRASLREFKPAKPEWMQIGRYYSFDFLTKKVMLTDQSGYRYSLDPESLTIEKTEKEIEALNWDEKILSSSGQFNADDYYYLSGDKRKQIEFQQKLSGEELSFLFGEWILDKDPAKAANRHQELEARLRRDLQQKEDSLSHFEALHPEAKQEVDYNKWTWNQRELHSQANELRRQIENGNRDLKQHIERRRQILSDPLMTTDQKSALILHANIISDTAHTLISQLIFNPDTTWAIKWTTSLPSIFRDPQKANLAGGFAMVTSKGNPTYDYRWAGILGDSIVLISQLRMICIDWKSGKLLWETEL